MLYHWKKPLSPEHIEETRTKVYQDAANILKYFCRLELTPIHAARLREQVKTVTERARYIENMRNSGRLDITSAMHFLHHHFDIPLDYEPAIETMYAYVNKDFCEYLKSVERQKTDLI